MEVTANSTSGCGVGDEIPCVPGASAKIDRLPLSRKTWIDSDYTDEGVSPRIINGVKTGEGDGTVSLLSLGAMCVEGWKHKRWNPAGIKVVTVEVGVHP